MCQHIKNLVIFVDESNLENHIRIMLIFNQFFKSKLDVCVFLLLLSSLASCSNASDGPLPEGFSWAYGSWKLKDYVWQESSSVQIASEPTYDSFGVPPEMWFGLTKESENYQVCIAADSLQIISDEVLYDTNRPLEYPYVELTPKYAYTISTLKDENGAPEVVTLSFVSRNAGHVLYLNRSNKTISTQKGAGKNNNRTRKSTNKVNSAVLSAYEAAVNSCPLIGDWQNINNRRDILTITASQVRSGFIPMKDGRWLDYFSWYDCYGYDKEKDKLILNDDIVYRRYGENQRRLDEERSNLERVLTSKVYSHMDNNVYSNTTVLHSYQFYKNGTGISELSEVQPYGRRVINRSKIEWEITADNSEVRVYDKELSGYVSFAIKNNGFSLVDGRNTYN